MSVETLEFYCDTCGWEGVVAVERTEEAKDGQTTLVDKIAADLRDGA